MINKSLILKNIFYLPSGRIFLFDLKGYLIEFTEMRDVSVDGKEHFEVRNSNDPHIIWKHLKPYADKWLLTVSTQKGCTHSCKFCDVANLPFKGNLSQEEIEMQIRIILEYSPYVTESKKVKIGFARMGEPAHNLNNVLNAMKNLPKISNSLERNFHWLPCFNSILPNGKIKGEEVIERVMDLKNNFFGGNLHFQISCNSTDEKTRKSLFGGANVMDLPNIVSIVNKTRNIGRTITLNFIVMEGIELDVYKLLTLGLNKEKFAVKLIPLNATINANQNKLKTYANYKNYQKLLKLKNTFSKHKIPVVVDAIAKCEEAGLCCGQLAQIYQ